MKRAVLLTAVVHLRQAPRRRRWVRYVMPVMVEVEVDTDRITRVVTLPEEIRDDRDDMGNFLVYDEKFNRRRMDHSPVDQPELHAWNGGVVISSRDFPLRLAGRSSGDRRTGNAAAIVSLRPRSGSCPTAGDVFPDEGSDGATGHGR
jgi:hypothetical protein